MTLQHFKNQNEDLIPLFEMGFVSQGYVKMVHFKEPKIHQIQTYTPPYDTENDDIQKNLPKGYRLDNQNQPQCVYYVSPDGTRFESLIDAKRHDEMQKKKETNKQRKKNYRI